MAEQEPSVVVAEDLAAIADLKMDLARFALRVSDLERRVGKVEPMVMDLRIEVADLMEQVSRGTRISLETQGEVREAFRALQRQNDLILERLGTTAAKRAEVADEKK